MYKIEILQPVYQQVAVKMGQVGLEILVFKYCPKPNKEGKRYRLLPQISALFIFFVYWIVTSTFHQQGQEYAALGALVNDDEPLSSPPGATEMELKVKQVCPDFCWNWSRLPQTYKVKYVETL